MISGTGYIAELADVWSMGICIYAYLAEGRLPFWNSESEIQTQLQIQHKEPEFPASFSEDLVELLKGLLHKDPGARLTLDEALEHAWFKLD
mmetsp:Transcript_31438/g.54522  ORF Transcript_31438/g.54522 Transcript_31438/m.54522 type:complete len:91 (+) Transcript_31438:748-1020(+)